MKLIQFQMIQKCKNTTRNWESLKKKFLLVKSLMKLQAPSKNVFFLSQITDMLLSYTFLTFQIKIEHVYYICTYYLTFCAVYVISVVFYTNRIQAAQFQEDLQMSGTRVLQIDYAMAYQYGNQGEVMGALWTRGSVNLFIAAVYHKGTTETFLLVTDHKGKDKFTASFFLHHMYANAISPDPSVERELILSDGPSSEFKVIVGLQGNHHIKKGQRTDVPTSKNFLRWCGKGTYW